MALLLQVCKLFNFLEIKAAADPREATKKGRYLRRAPLGDYTIKWHKLQVFVLRDFVDFALDSVEREILLFDADGIFVVLRVCS